MKLKSLITIFAAVCTVLLLASCVSAAQDNLLNDGTPLEIENNVEEISLDESINEISANETEVQTNDTQAETTQNETVNNTPEQTNTTQNETANNTPEQTNTTQNETANNTQEQTNTTPAANSTAAPAKTTKTSLDLYSSANFIQKSNKYLIVKVGKYNEKKNKVDYYKNVKLTVAVKIGSKVKTYNVTTNSKGQAKVPFNVKNLKTGTYTYTVKSNDEKYKINEKAKIAIYSKKTKTVTIKVNKKKKVKGDIITAFSINKNSQYKKGVYADSYNAKNPLDGISHTKIIKVKFFFKNKKTGKTVAKTVKSKTTYDQLTSTKLIKGYTPVKATIWYASL